MERARVAARMIETYSGGRLGGEVSGEGAGASLQVIRADPPLPVEYPTLVDPSLVWLTLAVVAPGEAAATLHWQPDGSVAVELPLHLPAEARPGLERIAQAIVFDAGRVDPPRTEHLDVVLLQQWDVGGGVLRRFLPLLLRVRLHVVIGLAQSTGVGESKPSAGSRTA